MSSSECKLSPVEKATLLVVARNLLPSEDWFRFSMTVSDLLTALASPESGVNASSVECLSAVRRLLDLGILTPSEFTKRHGIGYVFAGVMLGGTGKVIA